LYRPGAIDVLSRLELGWFILSLPLQDYQHPLMSQSSSPWLEQIRARHSIRSKYNQLVLTVKTQNFKPIYMDSKSVGSPTGVVDWDVSGFSPPPGLGGDLVTEPTRSRQSTPLQESGRGLNFVSAFFASCSYRTK
jgi:hypothetical protein